MKEGLQGSLIVPDDSEIVESGKWKLSFVAISEESARPFRCLRKKSFVLLSDTCVSLLAGKGM
jgi:hypothetical protein